MMGFSYESDSYPDILSYESCLSAVVESRFTLLHQITAAVM